MSVAAIDFQLNGLDGTVKVTNPTELKEFIIGPLVYGLNCQINANRTQTWEEFKSANFDTTYGCHNSEQLMRWIACPYKLPLCAAIPHTREAQEIKYEGTVERYY